MTDEGSIVGRVLRMLSEIAAGQESWGVRELARALSLPHTTTHRLLRALQAAGFVTCDADKARYRIGPEFYRIGLLIYNRFDLPKVARPIMEELSRYTGETVYVSVYVPDRKALMMIAAVESSNPLRYVPELYVYLPVHCGASGRAILAFLPDDEIESIISQGLAPVTDQTITDPVELRKTLVEVRTKGYAVSFGERVLETGAVAAPIWDRHGRVYGDIVLAVPLHRFGPELAEKWAPAVVRAANAITRMLGGEIPRNLTTVRL